MPTIKKSKPTKKTRKLYILYLLGLLLSISTALPSYIQSNFLKQFVDFKTISLFFIIANLFSIVIISSFPNLIRKFSNYRVSRLIFVIYIISLFGMTMANSPLSALVSIIFLSISSNLLWISMDILVESFSANSSTGKTRTLYFTFINIGWIISPMLTTFLINKGTYTLSFFISAILILPCFVIFLFQKNNFEDKIKKYKKESLKNAIAKMLTNKNLRGIFWISFLLQLFYSSAVIYVPLYLVQTLGMSWQVLGPIFSIMLIPFIVLEIPAGIIADKYLGEKEILFFGFIILISSLFLFYYINVPTAWLWALVLFFSRIGAALVEAMKETYFFKIIDAKDVSCINIFRLATPLAYVFGSALTIVILMFWPLNYIFLFLSIIMLSGLFFTASITDTK